MSCTMSGAIGVPQRSEHSPCTASMMNDINLGLMTVVFPQVNSTTRGDSATTRAHPRATCTATVNVTENQLSLASLKTRASLLLLDKMLTVTSSAKDSSRREATSMVKRAELATVAKL